MIFVLMLGLLLPEVFTSLQGAFSTFSESYNGAVASKEKKTASYRKASPIWKLALLVMLMAW